MTVALIDKFHEFYAVLLEVHAKLDKGTITADVAHDRLVALLNLQEEEAKLESGAYGRDVYRRAKYAMAALGDEVLVNPDHAHGELWKSHLLESALFRSQCAGEKIFDNITEMQDLGGAERELARIYLALLGLGFRGYRKLDPESEIVPYRRKLFTLAYAREPVAVTGQRQIVDTAYSSTLSDGEASQLPHLKPWIYAMVLIVVLYVAGSFAVWNIEINDLQPKVTTINGSEIKMGSPEAK
jgi:type VI secretion system protein ImpK